MKIFLIGIFVLYIAYMDWKEYYIPPFWMVFSCGFVAGQRLDGMALFSFLLPVVCLKWFCLDCIESADVFYIGLFACILGMERMIACLLLAIGFSFLFVLVYKRRYIPFVSFLGLGFMVALARGYTIYGILMAWM